MESSATDRYKPNVLPPLGIKIEETFSQLNVEASPYSLQGGREAKKESLKTHENKIQYGSKGLKQRDKHKLREKRHSTGVVDLASTESMGVSTTEEEEMEENLCSETQKNTQHNEDIGESPMLEAVNAGPASPDQENSSQPERKSCKRIASYNGSEPGHGHNSMHRPRLADKSTRSKDHKADDEQTVTDNDHDSLNLSEASSVTPVLPCTILSGSVFYLTSYNSTPIPRSTPTSLSKCVTEDEKDLIRQLQEKDRRIQFLEFKLQQITKDYAADFEEHKKMKGKNAVLLRAITKLT